jgi:hypothetical protein
MSTTVSAVIELLIRRKVFATEEKAVRALLWEYILRQLSALQRELTRFERKYGMRYEQFTEYLHERAIMQEEDDWLDWKVAGEMLESWLGLRREVVG